MHVERGTLQNMAAPVKQFEKEPGKVSTLIKLGKIAIKTEWSKTVPGEFPITEWRTFPLEIPSKGFKKHIIGHYARGLRADSDQEDPEVIHLPVYIGEDICDPDVFEKIPDTETTDPIAKIPVVTVATKACGECSCSGVRTQSLSVLPVWNDGTSMVLDLEWYEGDPAEGNINPEWYIQASSKLSVKEGLQKLKESSRPSTNAEKCCYCMHINPASLGTHVLGEETQNSCTFQSRLWPHKWKFESHEKMLNAIDKLSESLSDLSA
jgi:hypothetical protein